MFVIKRDGTREQVKFEKILKRISRLSKDLKALDPAVVSQQVIQGVYDGVSSRELDRLAIEVAYSMAVRHPDYDKLALRLSISSLHKDTPNTFSECIEILHGATDPFGKKKSMIDDKIFKIIKKNAHILNNAIDYNRDYSFDYFGYRTLERSYLLKNNSWDDNGKHSKVIIERPQHMWMRTAVGIHGSDMEAVIDTYELLSTLKATHATPTLFNSGTTKNQLSSCFLMSLKDDQDSIKGIYAGITEAALISQSAGGIGVHIHEIRSKGSPIYGTGGTSNGIVPMLKVFNETMRYVDQCFTGDTIVYTEDGPTEIRDVSIGDSLISSSGNFNRITKTFKNRRTGSVVEVAIKQSIRSAKVRHMHSFLTLKNQDKGVNFDVIKNRLDKGIISTEWVDAENLTTNDFIAFPIINNEIDYPYTNDDCRFYGLLLGDGWIHKNDTEGRLFLDTEKDDIKWCTDYLLSRGINPSVYKSGNNGRVSVVKWNINSNFKFSRAMLYNGLEKAVHKSMLNLPKDKTLNIVRGIIESDGHIGNDILLEMTSFNVIESIRYMLMRFGILTCGYDRDRIGSKSTYKNITTRKKTCVIRIPIVKDIADVLGIDEGDWVTFFKHCDFVYSRVASVKEVYIDEAVYDLEVEQDHDYLTHIGLAHNGGGKRKGSAAIYLEPWHPDVFDFLDLRKNHGKEELRARDLNLALWIPDLFFKRLEEDGDWTLMDPKTCPGLADVHSEAFEKLYEKYESKGMGDKIIKARELFGKILESCIETGQPYLLAKDACNRKSNQQNLGTIRSSNLCAEIVEYSDPDNTAVCNLASISLPGCIEGKKIKKFNFDSLYKTTCILTENLNKIIDTEFYPVDAARNSNLKQRPIGIGIQGLGTAFAVLKMPWESEEAQQLNKDIFETMYFAYLRTSCDTAKNKKKTYDSFEGSPLSEGKFQFDLWGTEATDRHDWESLRKDVVKYGVYNSLGIALMPTASTSQIMGNSECFEPITSNLYKRSTLSGEYVQINKHLIRDLIELKLWDDDLRQLIMSHNGSVQNINVIPQDIKDLYKTVWEISQKVIINMAADRGPYVCQSQSMNLYFDNPSFAKLSSAYMYAWKKGLKTLVYYTRSKAAREAIKFTIDKNIEETNEDAEGIACSIDNSEDCDMCGS